MFDLATWHCYWLGFPISFRFHVVLGQCQQPRNREYPVSASAPAAVCCWCHWCSELVWWEGICADKIKCAMCMCNVQRCNAQCTFFLVLVLVLVQAKGEVPNIKTQNTARCPPAHNEERRTKNKAPHGNRPMP
jgi:hypothetical protein